MAICEHVSWCWNKTVNWNDVFFITEIIVFFCHLSDSKWTAAFQESCTIQDLNNRIIPSWVLIPVPSARSQWTKTARKWIVELWLSSALVYQSLLPIHMASMCGFTTACTLLICQGKLLWTSYIKLHKNPSNRCRDISPKITHFKLIAK